MLLILYESGGHYHGDLSTSTSITLGVGIFPLVFAMVGWFYILYVSEFLPLVVDY